jgi:LPS-assembly protein
VTTIGRNGFERLARALLAGVALCLLPAGPALAQNLVPANFFNAPVNPNGDAGVEANSLTFDARTNVIRASGDVVLSHEGYVVRGDTLEFNRRSNSVRLTGRVSVTDPFGNVMETDGLDIGGGMKQAFLNALTITSFDGSRITADSVDYDAALQSVLVNASYAPCGDCIDDKGRRIGWSVNAAKITHDSENGSVVLEQPTLSLLGMPVAWLPYLWLPGTDNQALSALRMPIIDYSDTTGLRVGVPVMVYTNRWTDIILTPTLSTRQGFLMGAEWVQRFDAGSFQVKASGIHQWDPAAFVGTVGDRDWRGALQTSGSFTPIENWSAGWSYTAFSDAAYLGDYRLTTAKSTVNEVYATHLTDDTYLDVRLQEFNLLGNVTPQEQAQQGKALPAVRFNHVVDLEPGMGRVTLDGQLLSVQREADAVKAANGVPYVFGHAGNKTRATLQAGWQTQWINSGLVFTPYAGLRADMAYYDGTSPILPGETSLFSATPIAAMDIRYPLIAHNGADVHLIEPIGQMVYRGSGTSLVGITNDDAQSFVFDDTNLFSYNRFSGYDRQETGLRANIGARYQANFADGGYVEVVGGQSFQLAGTNAFETADPAGARRGSGMEGAASYAVLGAYGSFTPGLSFGGKVQVDTEDWALARAGAGMKLDLERYSATVDYRFIAADAAVGTLQDQHEVGGELTVPVSDYWSLKGNAAWDIGANSWLQAGGGLYYDDGYLAFGANATRTGATHTTPNDTRVTATFQLKAPAGLNAGGTTSVSVPEF